MSKVSVFRLPVGQHIEPDGVAGYYIDLRSKAEAASWPPEWFPFPGFHRYIAIGQWGLGCFERYVSGEGEEWLTAAIGAAEFLVGAQREDGGWAEPNDYPHTFRMQGPWLSGMAQGHCASLLVRVHGETAAAAWAESARLGLAPLKRAVAAGGVEARLDGGTFPEEYPTNPHSYVLNGAIYAAYGIYDVWKGLGDTEAGEMFAATKKTLAENIHRWDLGYWSRYDLYPHPAVTNVASTSYHALHINQLQALDQIAPHPEFAGAAARFSEYATKWRNRSRAFVLKALFRLTVPRNHLLARRMPWAHAPHVTTGREPFHRGR
jgi:heparosan-N-sulfate-glucuronate 5-epimerase